LQLKINIPSIVFVNYFGVLFGTVARKQIFYQFMKKNQMV